MQADLAFPQSLAEKYRPRTITEFIGLEKPKKILGKFAAKPYASAWLFVGPPGVGKTSIALALASRSYITCQAGSATRNPSKKPSGCATTCQ
jgi:DNA polymerase III gamma/tau subunit